MAARIRQTVVDARDAYAQSVFWGRVLGFAENLRHPNRPGDKECLVTVPDTSQRLLFVEVPEPKTVKNRLHLDLEAAQGSRDAELDRLLSLGARVVDARLRDEPPGCIVLADPEGNEFCLVRSTAERAAVRSTAERAAVRSTAERAGG